MLSVYFVAADVEVLVGKQPRHLADEIIQKLISAFLRRIHCRIENSPFAFDLIWTRRTSQFRITHEPGSAVPRHIELWHDANAAFSRVSDQIPDFVLGIEQSVRAHLMQLRKFLALDPEALIFGKMPVQDVQLHCCHSVQVAPENIQRNKVAADIDH